MAFPPGRPKYAESSKHIQPCFLECFLTRLLCFFIIMVGAKIALPRFYSKKLPFFSPCFGTHTFYFASMTRRIQILLVLVFTTVLSIAQSRYDVVINEIMADPTPLVGLPSNEWIELKNTSPTAVNLLGWRIADMTGQSGALPSFLLQPDSLVIVCTGSAFAAMSAFGTTITVTSFPSLDNAGEMLRLKRADGATMHAVRYDSKWYDNALKAEGGWSLEMIDSRSPCQGASNWGASIHPSGGTPGQNNSIGSPNPDDRPPVLLRAYSPLSAEIVIVFDEPVDSAVAASVQNFVVHGGPSIFGVTVVPPLFDRVILSLASPLAEGMSYNIEVSGIGDCGGNIIGPGAGVRTGLAAPPLMDDIIINEILFNPRPGCPDYVEFFNRSDKILDASQLFIANRNAAGDITSAQVFTDEHFLLFPGEYLVACADPEAIGLHYLVTDHSRFLQPGSMPSFPDDGGVVLLLDQQGAVLDELSYADDWHFALITDPEGISLERIDPNTETQQSTNWHSAASTAGYGTPGYSNSQFLQQAFVGGSLEILPRVFSPDNDGLDDVVGIYYKMDGPGYVGNLTIFNAAGRAVRPLVRNGTLAAEGHWYWDGLDEWQSKLPLGVYIAVLEVFNLQGRRRQFRKVIVVARKL